jgi:hypothetical protein
MPGYGSKPDDTYRCEVCDAWAMWGPSWAAWGTLDEPEAYVCSDACRLRFVPPVKSRRRKGRTS